jgi:hypothetical protein
MVYFEAVRLAYPTRAVSSNVHDGPAYDEPRRAVRGMVTTALKSTSSTTTRANRSIKSRSTDELSGHRAVVHPKRTRVAHDRWLLFARVMASGVHYE